MQPRVNFITLGVDDLDRSLVFYRDGLGLPTEGIVGTQFEDGAVAFFNLEKNLILALFPRKSLAKDANVAVGPSSATEFSLAHNVGSREEVDEILLQAEKAGATITDPAHERHWGGYTGYFQDPDGHLWEIAWNPDLPSPG